MRTCHFRDRERYKDLQNQVKLDNKKAHQDYLTRIFTPDEKTEKINKRTWTYIQHKGKDTSSIPTLEDNGVSADTNQKKAQMLSEKYQSFFTKEDTTRMPTKRNPLPHMPSIVVTTRGILKLLEKLNQKREIGS